MSQPTRQAAPPRQQTGSSAPSDSRPRCSSCRPTRPVRPHYVLQHHVTTDYPAKGHSHFLKPSWLLTPPPSSSERAMGGIPQTPHRHYRKLTSGMSMKTTVSEPGAYSSLLPLQLLTRPQSRRGSPQRSECAPARHLQAQPPARKPGISCQVVTTEAAQLGP